MRSKTAAITAIQIRVPYADTDQMGMVYYANYLVYFERGRTEWLRENVRPYGELEAEGYYFPVVECHCQYRSPVRYDDLITVRTALSEIGPASIEFRYEIVVRGRTAATGKTRHPLVNRDFKPVRLPEDLRKRLEKTNA